MNRKIYFLLSVLVIVTIGLVFLSVADARDMSGSSNSSDTIVNGGSDMGGAGTGGFNGPSTAPDSSTEGFGTGGTGTDLGTGGTGTDFGTGGTGTDFGTGGTGTDLGTGGTGTDYGTGGYGTGGTGGYGTNGTGGYGSNGTGGSGTGGTENSGTGGM
jgi:hypothetical protein